MTICRHGSSRPFKWNFHSKPRWSHESDLFPRAGSQDIPLQWEFCSNKRYSMKWCSWFIIFQDDLHFRWRWVIWWITLNFYNYYIYNDSIAVCICRLDTRTCSNWSLLLLHAKFGNLADYSRFQKFTWDFQKCHILHWLLNWSNNPGSFKEVCQLRGLIADQKSSESTHGMSRFMFGASNL